MASLKRVPLSAIAGKPQAVNGAEQHLTAS
jgi:hypothetical protein